MEIRDRDLQTDADGKIPEGFNAGAYQALDLPPLRRPSDSYLADAQNAAVRLFEGNGFKNGGIVKVDGQDWVIVGFNGCAYFHGAIEEVDPRLTVIVEDPLLKIPRYMTLEAIQRENPNGSKRAPLQKRISRTLTEVRRGIRDLFRD